MAQAILLTGRERRRRWSRDERAEILAAAFASDGIVSEVARRFDVSTGLIYTWRRQALAAEVGPAFVPARVVGLPGNGGVETAMFVDFPNGAEVRIDCTAPAELAAAVMRALK